MKARRIDANQVQIVKALRKAGCTVQSLASVGAGTPDLIVGIHGRNHLLEIKNPTMVPSKQRLTTDEAEWHRNWCGQVSVVETVEQALRTVGLI